MHICLRCLNLEKVLNDLKIEKETLKNKTRGHISLVCVAGKIYICIAKVHAHLTYSFKESQVFVL